VLVELVRAGTVDPPSILTQGEPLAQSRSVRGVRSANTRGVKVSMTAS